MNTFIYKLFFEGQLIQTKLFINIYDLLEEIKKYENELEYKIEIQIKFKGLQK